MKRRQQQEDISGPKIAPPSKLELIEKGQKDCKIKPFRILACAQSGGGKTFLISDLLEQILKKKCFKPQNVYWISSTSEFDPTQIKIQQNLKISQMDSTKQDIQQSIRALIEQQQTQISRGKTIQPVLLIFDDLISDALLSNNSKKSDLIKQLLTSGRHLLISSIILIQNLKSCPLTARLQMSHILLGMSPSRDKIQEWLQAYRGQLTTAQIIALYDQCRLDNDGYGMLLIQTQKRDTDPNRLKSGISIADLE